MRNNARKKFYFFALVLSLWSLASLAFAETMSETLCFVSAAKIKGREKERLTIKKYFDDELQEEIGALIKKGTGKRSLLLYDGDGTSDASLDYELHWLEFSEGKISGRYSLVKPRSASILGAYMKYKNLATGGEVTFSPLGESGEDCVLR